MKTQKEDDSKEELKNKEHRGNDEKLKKNFEEEMKMAQKSQKSYYTQEGGVKKNYM